MLLKPWYTQDKLNRIYTYTVQTFLLKQCPWTHYGFCPDNIKRLRMEIHCWYSVVFTVSSLICCIVGFNWQLINNCTGQNLSNFQQRVFNNRKCSKVISKINMAIHCKEMKTKRKWTPTKSCTICRVRKSSSRSADGSQSCKCWMGDKLTPRTSTPSILQHKRTLHFQQAKVTLRNWFKSYQTK